MIIKLLYIILAFLISNVFSQHVDGDTFLPDMGVVIQPADKFGKIAQPIDETDLLKSNNMLNKKESNSISAIKASDMISSIDRITSQVNNIEKLSV